MNPELFIADNWSYTPICYLCQRSGIPLQRHHKIFRSHQGDNSDENLVNLCIVCHNAVHGIKSKGVFNCDVCPKNCYFGQKFKGTPNVEKPW